MLDSNNNTLLQSYVTIKEYIKDNNLNPEKMHLAIHNTNAPAGNHPGHCHLPTTPKISLLMPTNTQTNICEYSVVYNVRENTNKNSLRIMPEHYQLYKSLVYPLMFLDGGPEWNIEMRSIRTTNVLSGKKVHLSPYVRYHIRQRVWTKNYMLQGQKLYQQYILDMYPWQKAKRLSYIHNKHVPFRADVYSGLADSIQQNNLENSGRTVVLPALITGLDR